MRIDAPLRGRRDRARCGGGGLQGARTAIRGFTLAADLKGEVAEWLKALAC